MAKLIWDAPGAKKYEYGTDRGVFYPQRGPGVAWPGLQTVSESYDRETVTGYLDGVSFGHFQTNPVFSATVTTIGKPAGFDIAEGVRRAAPFVGVRQQPRQSFRMSYRTSLGDDASGMTAGYKIHMLYNVSIDPTSYQHEAIGEDEEFVPFEFPIRCIPEPVASGPRLAHLEVANTETGILALETVLYGQVNQDPRLPDIDEVYQILGW